MSTTAEIQFAAYAAADGTPLAGLTPTWTILYNATTGLVVTDEPTITDLGEGAYNVESMPQTVTGVIDLGATAIPRFVHVASEDQTVVMYLALADGSLLTGLSLAWVTDSYQDATTGVAISTLATFTELGNGLYRVDDAIANSIGLIDGGATALSRYQFMPITAEDIDVYGTMLDLPLMSLAGLRLRSQQRSDQEGMEFIDDDEWTSMINASMYELYDIMIQAFGSDYFVDSYEFSLDGTGANSLPDEFYKLVGVDQQVGGEWRSVPKFNFLERNRFNRINTTTNGPSVSYRVVGSNMRFEPKSSQNGSMRIWYIPKMTQLVAETDKFDFISGWSDYVIIDVAIKAATKEESWDLVGNLKQEKQAMLARITVASESRDVAMPQTVSDVSGMGWDWS